MQKFAISEPSHNFVGLCLRSAQLRHVSTIGKKLIKQQYRLHMSSQYGELWPTNGWDRFTSLGYPRKFQRVLCLGFITAPTSLNGGQPNFGWCLAMSWASTQYIVSQKTSHLWLAITFDTCEWILIFLGRNVTDKVSNQKTLYYATSNNLYFCTTWQKGKHENCVLHSALPEFNQLLDFFNVFDSWLVLTLLYGSLNLVINAFSSELLGGMVQQKGSWEHCSS